jgi:hypothetical protein
MILIRRYCKRLLAKTRPAALNTAINMRKIKFIGKNMFQICSMNITEAQPAQKEERTPSVSWPLSPKDLLTKIPTPAKTKKNNTNPDTAKKI